MGILVQLQFQVLGGTFLNNLIAVRMNRIFFFQILIAIVFVSHSDEAVIDLPGGLSAAVGPGISFGGTCQAIPVGIPPRGCIIISNHCTNGTRPRAGPYPACPCVCVKGMGK